MPIIPGPFPAFDAAPETTPYARVLIRLLPPGQLWNLGVDSTLRLILLAMSDEFSAIAQRGKDLIEESDPRTADETIAEWEAMVGLPDDKVTTISAVLAERQVAVAQKYATTGGANLAFYQRLVSDCGYTLSAIHKYQSDMLRVGFRVNDRVYGNEYAYAIRLDIVAPTGTALTHTQLEAIVRHATHSHIEVVFNYL